MVGDHSQGYVIAIIAPVSCAAELTRPVQDSAGRVDLIDVVHALQQGGHSLEAHACVDVLCRKRPEDVEVFLGSHSRKLVLHEDEIPHF